MKGAFDAVVIGSGFGGAVAACRLAQAGCTVAILERGKKYEKGEFPRKFDDLTAGWLWSLNRGLFDVKPLHEMQVVQAAGWGGGSLIYANVHLRPPADVFAEGWPKGYDRTSLDPYYDLVATMLDVKPITRLAELDPPAPLPPKTILLKAMAEKLGRSEQLCYPNLALELEHPRVEKPNRFGVPQEGCRHCGECDIGCNYHAKNSLDLNYLAIAEKKGAKVLTLAEAFKIAPLSQGTPGYEVSFFDYSGGGSKEDSIIGKNVFVCAGAVNTTELLLLCRDVHQTLPALSDKLGHRYSGNGDFLAATYECAEPFEPFVGPTITTGIVYDRGEEDDRVWLILEDGGFPKEISAITELVAPGGKWLSETAGLLRADLASAFGAEVKKIDRTAVVDARRTGLFLAMGRDRADGRIELTPITNTLRIRWNVADNLPVYDAAAGLVRDLSDALGGKVEINPFWKRLHIPVSVHNLGGCVMADFPEDGVTSGTGEVYGYPGLHVLDGALLPSATGVNPSSTIAAVAERNVEAIIRRMTGNPGWRAPDWEYVKPVHDPLASVIVPPGGVKPLATPSLGLAFTEVMKGHIARDYRPEDDFAGAERAAEKAGTRAEFTLTITAPDLDAFLVDRAHAGIATGTLRIDGFTSPAGASVTAGVFNLFVDTDSFYERKMLYLLPFIGDDGKPYVLDGYKEVKDHGHFDVWGATSTLYTVVREGHTKTGKVVATGVLTIHITDFMHQMTTFEVTGGRGLVDRASALSRFGELFMGTLWDVFARAKFEG